MTMTPATSQAAPDITPDVVRHVANLARLELTEADVAQYTQDLGKIIGMMGQLNAVYVPSDIPPLAHTQLPTHFRKDNPNTPVPRDVLLANAPAREEDYFQVPRILDN